MGQDSRIFDGLIQEFYQVWFRFHPADALDAGVSGYEGLLPSVDDDGMGALASWLENLMVGLEEIDFQALDEGRQLDLQVLFGACQSELFALLEQDWRHRDPLRFLPVRAVHQLLLHPQVDLRGALEGCLSRIPEYLRYARSQLATFPELIPPPWLEAAECEGRAGITYLRELRENAMVRRSCKNPARIQGLCDEAVESMDAYLLFLSEELGPKAKGGIGCGEKRFLLRLGCRHFLPTDLRRLESLARHAYEQTWQELRELCLEHNGSDEPELWLTTLHERNPLSQSEMLEYVRAQSHALHNFLLEQGVFEIPQDAKLKVCEAPACLHSAVCAPAYVPPAPGDPQLCGALYFNLTDTEPCDRLPAVLTGQCIRDGWSGRHLQSVAMAMGTTAGTIPRRLHISATLKEGWPLYAEQLMFELGFTPEPEQSLMRLLERLRRCQLALLDIEIHCQGLEPGKALQMLSVLPGMTAEKARADLLEMSRYPTDALATVVGYSLIESLRELECATDKNPSGAFYNRLLQEGAVAAPLVIRGSFGSGLWERVRQQVGC
jgi:hypothetical protein